MTAEKAKTIIGNRVVALTRFIMEREGLSQDKAYAKLYGMEFFTLLSDPETRLFLEEDDYLQAAYDIELKEGVDTMYAFIKPES